METAIMVLEHLIEAINFHKSLESFTDKEKLEWIEKTVVAYKEIAERLASKNNEGVKVGGTD